MATIQRPVKTYGTRTYAGEVAAAPGNEDPILATEVDGDLDTIYAAWNGGADTVNLKDGSVTEAKLATDAHLWTISGTTIRPFDATKPVAIPGSTTGSLLLGSGTLKGRLQTRGSDGATILSCNRNFDAANAQDDATKPGWGVQLYIPGATGDLFMVQRQPVGSTTPTNLLMLDASG